MSYTDSPDINASGSRLLSMDSPTFPSDSSHSRTGHGGDDLSLSELSLGEQTPIMSKPFSLLAKFNPQPLPQADLATPTRGRKRDPSQGQAEEEMEREEEVEEEEELDEVQDAETARKLARELRDEKLKSDIFILKKLNASFEVFHEALQETGSANERVAAQIAQTDALLNKYINILSKSEEFARLIFDEKWQGAEADEEILEREIRKEQERARLEEEENVRKALEEERRLERERQEQLKREEKEKLEREKSERAIRGGPRGVRGTRASNRGLRGAASSRTDAAGGSSSRGVPRRPPSDSARPSGSGIPRSSYRPT